MNHQPPFPGELKVFSGRANPKLARKICRELSIRPGKIDIKNFSDGETGLRYEDDLRGGDVFIIQPTSPPVNEHLVELLIMIDTACRASAGRITAVVPYYGYARQDRKSTGRDPITAKLVANLITIAGATRILAIDFHASQIQGFFDIGSDHLYAKSPFIKFLEAKGKIDFENLVVGAADTGAIKLTRSYAKRLTDYPIAIIDKRRQKPNECEVLNIVGDVAGREVLIVDDMIDTGGTLTEAAEAFFKEGAKKIFAACTHPVLSGESLKKITDSPISKVFVTDTIYLPPQKRIPKIEVVSVAPLLAKAIKAIHENSSVSKLFV